MSTFHGMVGAMGRGSCGACCAPDRCRALGRRFDGDPCDRCPAPCPHRGSCCCACYRGPSPGPLSGTGCGGAACDPYHRGCASLYDRPPLRLPWPLFRSILQLADPSPPVVCQATHTYKLCKSSCMGADPFLGSMIKCEATVASAWGVGDSRTRRDPPSLGICRLPCGDR